MFNHENVNKISNDFASTFLMLDDKTLSNCLYVHELDTVTQLIKQHVPGVTNVVFDRHQAIADRYYVYLIEVR